MCVRLSVRVRATDRVSLFEPGLGDIQDGLKQTVHTVRAPVASYVGVAVIAKKGPIS